MTWLLIGKDASAVLQIVAAGNQLLRYCMSNGTMLIGRPRM